MKFNRRLPERILFFPLVLLVAVTSCKRQISQRCQDGHVFAAQVLFRDSVHDFGTFSSDSPVRRHVFSFTNTGKVPAVILDVNPSCRCVAANYTREAVQPGKFGRVEVTFDGTQSPPGYFDKSVCIRINSSHIYVLRIKGCMQ